MMRLKNITKENVTIEWPKTDGNTKVFWSDKNLSSSQFIEVGETEDNFFTLEKSTHLPHYLKVKTSQEMSEIFETPVFHHFEEQIEQLNRGLVAVPTSDGVFLSWRLLLPEVINFDNAGQRLVSLPFKLYKNKKLLAEVTDSTNYLDSDGTIGDFYAVQLGEEEACKEVQAFENSYVDIPLQRPKDGVTPAGQTYQYVANDLSVADLDGDGEYEFILKWDPTNAKDVSQRGYTGNTYLDAFKQNGQLLFRVDLGVNIRSGAHYTQFMCFDFDGDGRGELAFKTAPGTKVQFFNSANQVVKEKFITLPPTDLVNGVSHQDNYVASANDYRNHLVEMFQQWTNQTEVQQGNWPQTLEECFDIEKKYQYPLSLDDAEKLVDYFINDFAPSRSEKNVLTEFEGFIFKGPEYLTVLAGDGTEIETTEFPFLRGDDGLAWGDYAGRRIEPCNRVDRFLSGVAYLDGKRPYLIVCRGYYTRAAIAAYDLFSGKLNCVFKADSGHVPMNNPFNNTSNIRDGIDPIYGTIAGQGDHSLSCADVDFDGKMEIIYGGVTIDHDGSVLYSSKDYLPDGTLAKLGHGDAMHVADIDPDRPGYEIFNVFEGASSAPYGYALRKAEDGTVIFGEYEPVRDLGRCMVGDVREERGLQAWVNTIGTFDVCGQLLDQKTLGTNMSIRFLPDFSTQVIDGADYLAKNGTGIINDFTHGIVMTPEGTAVNNGTKGNPCLVVDLFGDYREELILRHADNSALRIYTNTDLSDHKLFTLMHDTQYRCGIAWQNNCYNQPTYPKFYLAHDMEMSEVLPAMKRKPTYYLAGDSTVQTYPKESRPQFGWGEFLLNEKDSNFAQVSNKATDFEFGQVTIYENQLSKVANYSMGGRSTKTFMEEGRLAAIEQNILPGDYLLIQFGHNDVNAEKAERYVSEEKFAENLAEFASAATAHQAFPIILSPIAICKKAFLQSDNSLKDVEEKLLTYGKIAQKFAKENHFPFIDVHQLAQEYFSDLKDEQVASYYMPDLVHLNAKGAKLYAQLIAEKLI